MVEDVECKQTIIVTLMALLRFLVAIHHLSYLNGGFLHGHLYHIYKFTQVVYIHHTWSYSRPSLPICRLPSISSERPVGLNPNLRQVSKCCLSKS